MKVYVVPWFKGKWKVIDKRIEYFVWRFCWFVYYPFNKYKYEWK
jgi:hypothetical protein